MCCWWRPEFGVQQNELESNIKKAFCKHAEKQYAEFIQLCCARELFTWEKGKAQPENLNRLMLQYKKIITDEDNRFHFIYYVMICANRLEMLTLGEQLLEILARELEKMEDEIIEQAKYIYWIEYYTQKLYHFFLKDEKEMVLKVIDELWHSPCKKEWIPKECNTIYSFYQNNNVTESNIDRHLLWGYLGY